MERADEKLPESKVDAKKFEQTWLGQLLGGVISVCCAATIKAYLYPPPPPRPSSVAIASAEGTASALQSVDTQRRPAQDDPLSASGPNQRPPSFAFPQATDDSRRRPFALHSWPQVTTVRTQNLTSVSEAPATSPPPNSPPPEIRFEVVTAPDIDERLFLMRALETLYEDWPIAAGDGGSLEAAIAAKRHEATRHQLYIQERGIEPRIAALYGDLVGLLDTYAVCLAEAGRIERGGAARVQQERVQAAATSGLSGGVMAGQAWNNGSSGGEALVTWVGMTLIGTLASEMVHAPARDEAKRVAVAANVREFTARHSEAVANAESAALALAERYGWARGEAGFDTTPEESRRIQDMSVRSDTTGLLRLLELARSRRPRDPFVRSVAAFQQAMTLGSASTPDALARDCDECLAAAFLVPKGAFYDPYRANCLVLAGFLLNTAAAKELQTNGWIAGPAERGPRALSLWRAYLAGNPQDPSGEAREQLAWALATTKRFDEAATVATQVANQRGNDPNFAYGYACLLSLTGQTEDSLRWLEHAYRKCHHPNILAAKSDPDLAAVRTAQSAGFNALAAVKFTWRIDWGIFDHDDICLVNDSSFSLTGVTLDVTVDSKGSAQWTRSLKVEKLEPDATYRWQTWITARGKDANGMATLTCDQQR